MGGAEARAHAAMHNFGPQVEALSRFDAPPGWGTRTVRREASATPGAAGVWRVPGDYGTVRDQAVAAFTTWADSGSVVARSRSVSEYAVLDGRRGPDRVELSVAADGSRPGFVLVEVTASRLPPWQS